MDNTDKAALRRQLRLARQHLPAAPRRQATQRINRRLRRLIKRGHRVGAYWASGSELGLDDWLQAALKRGARVYLPYIEQGSQRLWFTPYRRGLKPERARGSNFLNIPQFGGAKIRAHQLHVLIVPLVGIDRRGCRLGQGGGYYDVTLAHTRHRLRPRTVGAGFACQQVAAVPAEPHDAVLNAFVSEHGWQHFAAGP